MTKMHICQNDAAALSLACEDAALACFPAAFGNTSSEPTSWSEVQYFKNFGRRLQHNISVNKYSLYNFRFTTKLILQLNSLNNST